MPRMTLTCEFARAAATDAGNENMRQHGRKRWSRQDYNVAVRTFNKLCPEA